MCGFQAANPGAILEDFVRWYSPRDWIESEEVDKYGNVIGELSPRMRVKGNLWSEVWSTAKAVPARRQKRLFDDTKEAEKVRSISTVHLANCHTEFHSFRFFIGLQLELCKTYPNSSFHRWSTHLLLRYLMKWMPYPSTMKYLLPSCKMPYNSADPSTMLLSWMEIRTTSSATRTLCSKACYSVREKSAK